MNVIGCSFRYVFIKLNAMDDEQNTTTIAGTYNRYGGGREIMWK